MLYSFNDPIPAAFGDKLTPTFWINGARLSQFAHGVTDIVQQYTAATTMRAAKLRGDLIYLDCECTKNDFAATLTIARTYAAKIPAIRRGMFGPGLAGSIEDYIAAAKDPHHKVHDWFISWRPVFDCLDYVDCPAYLLGEKYVDRDLEFIECYYTMARLHYPQCRPIHSAWGNFHTSWNPDNTPLPDEVLKRYVATLRRHNADCIIFDPKPRRDEQFINLLSEPSGRPATRTFPSP
jgi:hypothetical protein